MPSVRRPYGSGCIRIARTIEKRRASLRRALAQRIAEQSYGIELIDHIVDSFLARIARAFRDASWDELLDWVEQTCRERTYSRSVHRLFTIAPFVLTDEFCTFDDAPFDSLSAFALTARRMAAIARERCTSGITPLHRPVDSTDGLLTDLLNELYSIDRAAAEHVRAVSGWCAKLARHLGLSERETLYVARGGLVHDIGRCKTPPEILRASRRLAAHELAIVREHVVSGEAVMRTNSYLHKFVPFARFHHERFDGTGYPDGLEGDRIPLAVRIVTVADSFNAMITARPYRGALDSARALHELRRCKSTQFDPVVVEAMIDLAQAEGRLALPSVTALAG